MKMTIPNGVFRDVVVGVLMAICIILIAYKAQAADIKRNRSVITKFRATNPCPESCATYTRQGSKFVLLERCGACEVDHICPLACGGADAIENLQWLSAKENHAKGARNCELYCKTK